MKNRFVAWFFLCPVFVLGQTTSELRENTGGRQLDSLLKLARTAQPDSIQAEYYLQLLNAAILRRPLQLEEWFNEGMASAERSESERVRHRFRIMHAAILMTVGKFAEASDAAEKVSKDFAQFPNPRAEISNLLTWGKALVSKGDKERALTAFSRAIDLSNAYQMTDAAIVAMTNFATLLEAQQRYREMRDVLLKVIMLAEEKKLLSEANMARVNLSFAEDHLGNYGRAEELLNQALTYYTEQKYDPAIAICLQNLSFQFIQRNRSSEALPMLRRAEAIRSRLRDALGLAKIYRNFSRAFLDLQQFDSSLLCINKALYLFDSLNIIAEKAEAVRYKADILAAQKKFREAAALLDTYDRLKDSSRTLEKEQIFEQEIQKFRAKYPDSSSFLPVVIDHSATSGWYKWVIFPLMLLFGGIGYYMINKKKHPIEKPLETIEFDNNVQGLSDQIQLSRQQAAQALQGFIDTQLRTQDFLWNEFLIVFLRVYPDFFKGLKKAYPTLSQNELQLCALIKVGMANESIGEILDISEESVRKARYRISRKMNVSGDDALDQLLNITG